MNFKNCNKITHTENLILDYIIHLFILVLILCLIFFLFISKTQRENLNNSLESEISKSIGDTHVAYDPALGKQLKDLSNIYKGENSIETYYNQGLINISIAVILCFFVCLLAVYWTMRLSAYKCPPIYYIVFKNILLFMLVGIVEYLFFVNIAEKYVPVGYYISELLNEKLS